MTDENRSNRVVSGVYISSEGTRKVMNRKAFLTKLHLKGKHGQWRHARVGE